MLNVAKTVLTDFQKLISRRTEGYDVVDFRVGTLIGTTILTLIPIANAHFDEQIPDIPTARNLQIVVQILAIIASYYVTFIKKWANEIGNLFSFLFALQLILVVFNHNYPVQETAVTLVALFALLGMFKTKRALTVFSIAANGLYISLCWLAGDTPLSKEFMTAIGSIFYLIGYYVFYIRIDYVEKLSRREIELEKSELWFRNIFDSAPVGIVMLNERLNGFRFNSFFEKITGYTEGELQNMSARKLIHADDIVQYSFNFDKATTTELRILTKKEEIIWVRVRMSPMEADGKKYMIAMVSDISEQRQTAQQLEKTTEALQAHNDALEEFSYVISHDLQEPLRMITSFTQIIQRRHIKNADEETQRDFGFVIDGAKRMSTLIRDMLEYSRWSARTLPVEVVDTREVLAEAMQNLTVAIGRSGAEVMAGNLPSLIANRHMLVQVIQNLVSNAIKYRHIDRAPRIEISVEKRENDWLFSFKDNGEGFESRFKERIFGIFQRLQIDRATGNGIGLAICKRIVERQGGAIWADSVVGEGSVFQFTLPFFAVENVNTEGVELLSSDLQQV